MITETVFQEVMIRRPDAVGVEELRTRAWIRVVPDPEIPLRLYQRGQKLHRGELTSLALCLEHPGSIALMDDQAGRIAARRLGISLRGTLGILLVAKKNGRIASLHVAMDDLKAGGFWVAPGLMEELLQQAREA
ncbi:MAG TPA: DUF3368 domain-containing protein [Myxococcota bacterium]|nr:DUF3368 domain-containing protein [Myxococcota bacterium]HNH47920.1 DUF3368 domain-containing protein [Myxococcota bacterium]